MLVFICSKIWLVVVYNYNTLVLMTYGWLSSVGQDNENELFF